MSLGTVRLGVLLIRVSFSVGRLWSSVALHVHVREHLPGNVPSWVLPFVTCKIPKQLTQCRNISEWRRCFILLVWLRRKGIILSVSLNGAMAEMSNQLKSRLESGVTTPRLHQMKTGQKRSQLTLYNSLKSYGCSKNTEIFSFVSDSILQILIFNV